MSSCFFTFKGFDVDRPKPGKLWTLYLGEIYNVTMSCVSSLATSLPGLTACHHPQTKANKTTHGHSQGEEHPHLRTGGAPQRGSQRGPQRGPQSPGGRVHWVYVWALVAKSTGAGRVKSRASTCQVENPRSSGTDFNARNSLSSAARHIEQPDRCTESRSFSLDSHWVSGSRPSQGRDRSKLRPFSLRRQLRVNPTSMDFPVRSCCPALTCQEPDRKLVRSLRTA